MRMSVSPLPSRKLTALKSSWLPFDPIMHCLTHTQNKVILFDAERLKRMSQALPSLRSRGTTGILVLETANVDTMLTEVHSWTQAIQTCELRSSSSLDDIRIQPEDHATVIFTSGTYVGFYCSLPVVDSDSF